MLAPYKRPFGKLRVRLVMRLARLFGVPVDVHGSYFGTVAKSAKPII